MDERNCVRLRHMISARTFKRFVVAVACSVELSGCGEDGALAPSPPPINGIVAGTVQYAVARPYLTLRNSTEFQVGYLLVETGRPIIALFPPCASNCSRLKQGEQTVVNFNQISGYSDKTTSASLLWWKYQVEANGTLTAIGAIQTVEIKLN